MDGLPGSLSMAVTVSPAITSTLGAGACQGLEKPAYGAPADNIHKFTWIQQMPHRSYFSEIRANTSAGAGVTDITFAPGTEVDQVMFVAVKLRRPAIKGVRAERLEDITTIYPTDDNRKVLKADAKAAAKMAVGADADDLFGDGASSYGGGRGEGLEEVGDDARSVRSRRSGRRSRRADAVAAGVRAYVEGVRGGTGVCAPFACELSRGDDDAASVRTTATRTPAHQKHYAYYVKKFAYAAVSTFVTKAGTNVLDVAMGRFGAAIHDTDVTGDHKVGLRELTLDLPNVPMSAEEERAYLIEQSSRPQEAWFIVPAWFTTTPQLAYNNYLSDWSALSFVVATAPWSALIRRSDASTRVVKKDGTELKDSDLGVTLVLGCIQLDPALRDAEMEANSDKSATPVDYLVKLHGYRKVTPQESNDFRAVNMKWPHAVLNMRWHFQRRVAELDNDAFNWDGLFGDKPYNEFRLLTSSSPYQEGQSELFYRLVQPYLKETACPALSQGMLGWALLKNQSPYVTGSMTSHKFATVLGEFRMQDGLLANEPSSVSLYICFEYLMIIRHQRKNIWSLYQRTA